MSEARRRRQPGGAVRGLSTERPVMVLLALLGRRWTLRILWELHLSSPESLTFRALQQSCERMSSSVLNQRLRELRDARLVADAAGGYALTADGSGLTALLLPLDAWARNWSRALEDHARSDR